MVKFGSSTAVHIRRCQVELKEPDQIIRDRIFDNGEYVRIVDFFKAGFSSQRKWLKTLGLQQLESDLH